MPAFNLHQSGLRAILTGVLLALASSASAATGGFTATLSADQQAAAGLPVLTQPERNTLDQLVAMELASVRQSEPAELLGSFVSRRTDAERQSAGLDRLAPAELARLNELVASALATRPKPKDRPRLKEDDVIGAARKPEIHGSVTLAYGWSRGGSFRGASLWLDYFDPNSGLGIGLGLSDSTGPGYFYGGYGDYGFYPGYYGYGSRFDRYDSPFPVYYDASFRGARGGDFVAGDGQSFRAAGSWDAPGHDRRRR